jgi:hypothetical protein
MMTGPSTKHLSTRLTLVGVGLFPMLTFGLGLSDLQLESRLNQQLRARIEITDVTDEEWREIHARLAQNASADNTVIHPELLDSIRLRTIVDRDNRHFVEITSQGILVEPAFDLPIEVFGPSMRVIRSYSVLLDPPGLNEPSRRSDDSTLVAGATSPVTRAARTSADAARPVTETAAPTTKAMRPAKPARTDQSPETTAGQQPAVYVVKNADTLERIARHLGVQNASERKQLMQWIFDHNAAAFYGDIHHLHSGAHLMLPDTMLASRPGPLRQDSVATAKLEKTRPQTPEQVQLEAQITTLQESLTQLQETISTQDAEITRLTAQVAASTQSHAAPSSHGTPSLQAARSPHVAATSTNTSSAADDDEDEEPVSNGRPALYYWIGGAALSALAAIAAALFMRKRKQPAKADFPAPSRERAAPERTVTVTRPTPESQPKPVSQPEKAVSPAKALEKPSEKDTQEVLDWDKGLWNEAGSFKSWRDQTTAEPDPLFDTEVLPQAYTENLPTSTTQTLRQAETAKIPVRDTQPMRAAETPKLSHTQTISLSDEDLAALEQSHTIVLPAGDTENLPQAPMLSTFGDPGAGGDSGTHTATIVEEHAPQTQEGQSLVNMEVAKILEASLTREPNRVDLKIKLLDIYHQEGNYAAFESMAAKLLTEQRTLTPAQQLHVERLRQTLAEDQRKTAKIAS